MKGLGDVDVTECKNVGIVFDVSKTEAVSADCDRSQGSLNQTNQSLTSVIPK